MIRFTRQDLEGFRDESANRLMLLSALLVSIAVPATLSRYLISGWQFSFYVYIGCGLLIFVMAVIRRRLSLRFKINTLATIGTSVAIAALANWGLLSNGMIWFVITGFILMIAYTSRLVILYMLFAVTIMTLFAWLFYSGTLKPPVEANQFASSHVAWINAIVSNMFSLMLIMIHFSYLKEYQQKLISLLEEQNQEISRLANHDNLTGLHNLRVGKDRITQAINFSRRNNSMAAVLFIDLDGFKEINDEYGHDAGDAILIETAHRLSQSVREVDTVARIGGDEFLVILQEASLPAAVAVAEKLIHRIKVPFTYEYNSLSVTASLGIALTSDAQTAEELIKKADSAMYQAKRQGKNRYALFSSGSSAA
ncbi:GGDEF domain-containing protein [Nitrincola alkalilacustris]|uniref:GGDEF domain-containing protein n=1 Tax=Nitrincola alkalilacustris TaxID=1571224 RepID=UPI00124EE0B9|nr:GGDEF domain-containing protein [Nitrincola alkalilacustris]